MMAEADFKSPNFVRLFVKGLETKKSKILIDSLNHQSYIIHHYLDGDGCKVIVFAKLKRAVVEKDGIVLEDMMGGELKVYGKDLLEYNEEGKFWKSGDIGGGSLLYYEDGRWELEEPGGRLKRKVG